MRDQRGLVGEGVFELECAHSDGFFGVEVGLLGEGDLVLPFVEFGVVEGGLGVVAVALGFGLLDDVGEHEDAGDLVLLDHPPEVVEGGFGDGSLGGDGALAQEVDEVGVYVVFDALLVTPEVHASGFEGHVLGVAIQFVLFWVFVEFVDVVLRLGHEGQQLELGGQTAVHAFESELDLLDLEAKVAKVFVFSLPLQRDVLVLHVSNYYKVGVGGWV